VALCPAIEERSRVEPSPLDLELAPERTVARRSLGVSAQRLVVVVGRLIADKRIDLALSAGSLLPDSTIVVVGDGPALDGLRERFPNVRFEGRLQRSEALAWIAAADLLLSTSLKEGAPTVVREAIALGVDVVACPAGDLAAWAEHERLLWVIRNEHARDVRLY
jgi:glycosyltransferase involved in cell wall biosynthesis